MQSLKDAIKFPLMQPNRSPKSMQTRSLAPYLQYF